MSQSWYRLLLEAMGTTQVQSRNAILTTPLLAILLAAPVIPAPVHAQEVEESSPAPETIAAEEGESLADESESGEAASVDIPDEVVVTATFRPGGEAKVLEERRMEKAVVNFLASEHISKAGDSDAAAALKRVTGLTLVGGRFIYVRGLGERYSSTLLNGANLPSPDPVRRVVPLDLFPTSIIDSIAIRKGYTPDMPAEFGGGTVQLRTKNVPREAFLQTELSIGYRDGTTGKDGLGYAGGGSDWTGFDNGTRDMTDLLAEASANGTRVNEYNPFTGTGYSKDELEAIGESLAVNYAVKGKEIDPDIGFSISAGNRFEPSEDITLGFMGAVDYDDKWVNTTQQRTEYIVSGDELESENDYLYDITGREISLSGFLTAGAEIGIDHKVTYNLMLLRNTTDKAQTQSGFNKDILGGDVRFSELEWIERELLSQQLLGEHLFPGLNNLSLNWSFTKSTAQADEPDVRTYRYDPDALTETEDDLIYSLRNDSNQRRWSELDDDSDDWSVGATQPLNLWDQAEISVSGGVGSVKKDRLSTVRRFAFQSRGPISGNPDLRRNLNPEDVIFADTIDPLGWQINDVTIATDAYTADQTIDSWYLSTDFFYRERLRLGGGVRGEQSDQSVTTFDIFDPDRNPVVSSLSADDLFPSATATLIFGDHQFLAGYGKTTNRPDFKELSPSLFKDPLLDRQVIGNPNLKAAYITNYDLRWDYYSPYGKFVSLGVFYKDFKNPIETVIKAGGEQITTYANAESAENFGVEFELRTDFTMLGSWWLGTETWEKFYVSTNYAWIDSEITLSEDAAAVQTSASRPLQGQSPYVLNFQLGYDDLARGINAALLFNMFGERIVDVGTNGAPDHYEQPRPQLDFIYAQRLGTNWKLKFKGRNLLDPEVEVTQGSETRLSYSIGREVSLALEWSY